MTKTKRSCVVYCRISLDRTGEGAGVERQEKECRELAARLGLEVLEPPYVEDAISATTGKLRPQFEALLEARPAAIVVWHLDRLIRTSRELEKVLDLKCNVHAVTSGHLDLSHPAGRATAKTVTAWAQYEGEQKSERQKAAHRQRVAAGKTWWSTRAFGWVRPGEVFEAEAKVLGLVYAGVAAGDTNLAGWARWMNDAGWRTTGKGREFGSITVRLLLLAERNLAFVPEDTWITVRDILRGRSRETAKVGIGLLSGQAGALRCGVCGSHMNMAVMDHAWVTPGRAYRCRASGCVSWPVTAVDEIVAAEVRKVLAKHRTKIEAKVGPAMADETAALQRLALDFAAERISAEDFVAASGREKERLARRAAKPLIVKDWADLTQVQRRAAIAVLVEEIPLPPRGQGARTVNPDVLRRAIAWR